MKPEKQYRLLLIGLCALILVYSLVRLAGYFMDLSREQQVAESLRNMYHEAVASSSAVPEPETTENIPAADTAFNGSPVLPLPTVVPVSTIEVTGENQELPGIGYPEKYLLASDPFLQLKQQNQDIVAWLTIDDVVDDAVVQKDNSRYLNRDYLGNSNINGALFLDEAVSLRTRPYTLMIFGHNMKSGAMFGKLLKYRDHDWYRTHAWVTCNTQYENGEYVIFSVAKVRVTAGANYVGLYELLSDQVDPRNRVIDQLKTYSCFSSNIDVKAEDQLLLLITCDGDEDERFVVTARRIRENEKKEDLYLQIMSSCAR